MISSIVMGWFDSGAWCRRCDCKCAQHRSPGTSYRHIGAAPLAVQAILRCPKRRPRDRVGTPGDRVEARDLLGSGGALRLRLLARRRSTPGRRKVGWRQRMLRRLADGSPCRVRGARLSAEMLGEEVVEHFACCPGILTEAGHRLGTYHAGVGLAGAELAHVGDGGARRRDRFAG